jgi:hypothetical protein
VVDAEEVARVTAAGFTVDLKTSTRHAGLKSRRSLRRSKPFGERRTSLRTLISTVGDRCDLLD